MQSVLRIVESALDPCADVTRFFDLRQALVEHELGDAGRRRHFRGGGQRRPRYGVPDAEARQPRGQAVGLRGEQAVLRRGHVITVEPGLYFQEDDLLVPEELRGIGIRIEDDVLVTADGYENLSAALPRTVEGIEAWMASLRS